MERRSGGNRSGGRGGFGRDNRGGSRGGFGGSRGGGFGNRDGGGFRRNNFNSGPREMHKAICSECKKECEVPFKPTEGKPVYCRECFMNR